MVGRMLRKAVRRSGAALRLRRRPRRRSTYLAPVDKGDDILFAP